MALWYAAEKVIEKARQIVAHQLEVAADDLEFANGTFTVKGSPDKEMTLAAVAWAAFAAHDLPDGMEPGLEATAVYDPPNFSWPAGAHAAVVEVDTETGDARLVRYVAVDDVGTVVNPLIVDGQVHGGITQGIAAALYEEGVYDEDGNLQTANLVTYLVPSAAELPSFELERTESREPDEPARREGRGGDGHDRGGARGDQRGARRALAPRREGHPDAGHARACLARDPGGEGVIPARVRLRRRRERRPRDRAALRGGGDAKLLAGGQSLIPALRLRIARPAKLVDLGRLVRSRLRARRRHARRDRGARRATRPSRPIRCSRSTARSSRTPRRRSAIRRCVTAARSAGRSPTATRPPTCRP